MSLDLLDRKPHRSISFSQKTRLETDCAVSQLKYLASQLKWVFLWDLPLHMKTSRIIGHVWNGDEGFTGFIPPVPHLSLLIDCSKTFLHLHWQHFTGINFLKKSLKYLTFYISDYFSSFLMFSVLKVLQNIFNKMLHRQENTYTLQTVNYVWFYLSEKEKGYYMHDNFMLLAKTKACWYFHPQTLLLFPKSGLESGWFPKYCAI